MLLVVVATYNERLNLPGVLARIWEAVPEARVLVVDDDSPDGTGRWCEEQALREPRLAVRIRRGERGLGSATIFGLKAAIEGGFQAVATLDADGSHDPAALRSMFERLAAGPESLGVVIGSRYTPGGAIVGWPWYRRWTSRFVNFWVRCLLGLPTRDNSGAFRVYRVSWLERLGLERIRSTGYAYLEEMLFRLRQAGAEAVELPITFRDRLEGNSKANWREAVAVIFRVLQLRCGG
ncbi:MAG: polyprenol monophosphomannose synthase [Planctomycetota bacterium]|jgi:dolichol-phosphate mannosyltransferase